MKKIFKSAIFLFLAGGLLGCSALEQRSESVFTEDLVFANYKLARYAVNAIYNSYITTTSYRTDYFEYYGANTDVDIRRNGTSDTPQNNFCQYKMSALNASFNRYSIYDMYPGNFCGIERANLCLRGLKAYGNIDEDPQMGALYGEVLVARALLYADLLNYYGEVPARFEPTSQETIYLPKSDKDVIYKQLLKDLEEAPKYLSYDEPHYITTPGKALAKGLYARLALQAAGYSRRPDEGMVNTGNMGSVRKSNDPELQASVLYPKALAALDDVIQNAGLELFYNYEDLWKFYCDCGAEYGTAKNREIIFGMPFADNRGQHLTRNAVTNKKYHHNSSGGRISLNPTLFFHFDPKDLRRDVTCCPCEYDANGEAKMSGASAGTWYCGKFRLDWRTYPEHEILNGTGEDGCKFPVMRYADILLMAAEIANELGDLPAAKEYMRPVLQRAFHDDAEVQNHLDGLTNKDLFFDDIVQQRAFEFAGELLRRQDLIRWNMLKEKLDEAKAEMQNMSANAGNYSQYPKKIWYRLQENYIDPEIWGFAPGQTTVPPADDRDEKPGQHPSPDGRDQWVQRSYFSTLGSARIDYLYLEDPDMYMYRPIPAAIITANMGVLKNDYGY